MNTILNRISAHLKLSLEFN